MRRWDGESPLAVGTVLATNLLSRMGRHELWDFCRVSHVTPKGSILVSPMERMKTKHKWDEQQNSVGRVKPVADDERDATKKRLSPKHLYYILSDLEIRNGISEEGCCR